MEIFVIVVVVWGFFYSFYQFYWFDVDIEQSNESTKIYQPTSYFDYSKKRIRDTGSKKKKSWNEYTEKKETPTTLKYIIKIYADNSRNKHNV